MSSPQFSPSPPHQYPQAIQLKLYQAFIFSIPILFSIILFLLFYLFYLKRRASSSTPILPRMINDANMAAPLDSDLKNGLNNKMYTILFDEYMRVRDSLCCVCLGEFVVDEELLQVPSCKHMFHVECIRYWLHNHSTCPLCRAAVVSDNHVDTKSRPPAPRPSFPSNLSPSLLPRQQSQLHNCIIPLEGSSSGTSSSGGGGSN